MQTVGRMLGLLVLVAVSMVSTAANLEISQLHVRGEAELLVSPDQASLVLGLTTEGKTVKQAMSRNTQKMNAVINALVNLGVADSDYKTQQFRVQPVWSSRPNGAGSQWKAKIVSYRVINQLRVTTQDLALVGDLIAGATDAGANQVSSISFGLANPRQYRSLAIEQAMANARADAETLAVASGDRIKRTLSLHLDNSSASRVQVKEMAVASSRLMQDHASSPPPVSSGDITVRAAVSVTYELEEPAL